MAHPPTSGVPGPASGAFMSSMSPAPGHAGHQSPMPPFIHSTGPMSTPTGPSHLMAATNSNGKAKLGPSTMPGTLNGPPSGNNHAIPLSARRAERLDMKTVVQRGQDQAAQRPQGKPRMFNIPDAPVFYPTEDEFRDPMEYMRTIAAEGSKHGIVKIVPPKSWNPTFAINTERFHFRTRRQELNSVEGGNRVNNDYLDQLARFHKQHGHNLNRFPSVDKRPLDLYRLKKTVERKGGFEMCCKTKRWAEIGRDLGYSGKIMSSLSTSLKNSYQKWLLPYEEYLKVAKPGVQHHLEMLNGGPYTPSPGPSPAKKSQGNTPVGEEAMRASAALQANINGHSPSLGPVTADASRPPSQPPTQPPTQGPSPGPPGPSGAGGFTPVNGGFTAVNSTTPSASFTTVNAANGNNPSNNGTPQAASDTTPVPASGPQPIAPHPNGLAALKRQHSESILTTEEIEAMNRRSKRLRKDVPTVAGSNMHHSRMSGARLTPARDRTNFKRGEHCENCARAEDAHKFIQCANCEGVYHMYCLEPPLKQKPEYEWNCPSCLVGINEYGFEEGDVYSLSGFQKRANEFKELHFHNLPTTVVYRDKRMPPTEDEVEREFWRLVDDIQDTTEVEYGADIHSTTHGSGFPTVEKHPRDAYSTDPWNLNMLPLDKESLFRHIKSDISGMTVPWLYVGMIFSTFCWHNEDHFTYSANYQHFGETKTWYGIPAEDSYKFEQAMRDEVPELFETQPDLLFQLVTLARPEKLRKAGVRVFAIDQHAGEFVITFPRAYHAGFNHGFNFNEAVNFAPVDWEPFGEEGVKRLREYRRQPCFSHDELLLTAASRDQTIKTSKWLAPALERMMEEELEARKHFLHGSNNSGTGSGVEDTYVGPRYEAEPQIIDPEATDEDESICTFCKSYCYLSRFECKKTNKSLCLLHAGNYECCDATESDRHTGKNGEHVLYLRMTDEVLSTTVRKVHDKANIPETWMSKVDAELEDNPRPSLKHLRTLLTEGEKIQYELPQLPDLRRFVERCNDWVEEATNYITRKQQVRRKSEKSGRKSNAKVQEMEERERELRNVDNIRKLLAAADELSFDCSEINTLRERADAIAEWQRDAIFALQHKRGRTTAEFEELVERGKDFHVDMPEIDQLEVWLKRLRWDDMAKLKRPNPETRRQDQTLQDIEDFIQQGYDIGVADSHPDMVFFREHKSQAELWEHKAKELMASEPVHYQQLDSLSTQAVTLPVSAETLAAVDAILRKQREVQERISFIIEQSKDPDFRARPMYKDMRAVVEALEELQSKPSGTMELETLQKTHENWMRKGKKLFGKANAPLHILHQHMNIVKDRNEACFDLRDKPRMPVEPSSRQASPEPGMELAGDESGSSRDVFCICRKVEAGMMIECEICHEWYHGKCLKIARGKVKEDDKYTCPICDWRVKIPRDAARPRLEELQAWYDELETLPFQPEEEDTLSKIVEDGQNFREFMRPFINPENPTTPEEIPTLRFHLRKIEGADILLTEETNFLRRELHRWHPIAPEPPPAVEASGSTRKPRPTKQQKLMARYGVTNPDDLPAQYKVKNGFVKTKIPDNGKPPLQPAAGYAESPGGSQSGEVKSASPSAPTPEPGGKKFLTALALQVLGDLAATPVVSPMLKLEPHMNTEKLSKMKHLIETEPSVRDDVDAMRRKLATVILPSPSGQFSYETHNRIANPVDRNKRVSTTPKTTAAPRNRNRDSDREASRTRSNLGSPANFTHHQFPSHASPPTTNNYDPRMFETAGDHAMFDTPAVEHRPSMASPDYGARSSGIFDSPKVGNMVHASPHFGSSQQSTGNMDHVFADLVNDHDGGGDSSGIAGMDSAQLAEAAVAAAAEQERQEAEMQNAANIDPALQNM